MVRDSREKSTTIFSDSQSTLQAINHPNPTHPIVQVIQNLLIDIQQSRKEVILCKVPSHIGVEGNEAADRAANEARNIPGLHTTLLPHRDFYPPIHQFIHQKWQERWNTSNTHLRLLKPTVGPWPPNNYGGRIGETKIARLRIGHCRLTHGYYMSRTRPPECTHCRITPLTMEHILIHCPLYQQERSLYGLPNCYANLLGNNCPALELLKFLSTINVLKDI